MEQQIIKCVFCKGKGENPHFRGTCPVCKGTGKNQVTGKYMACGDCHGLGQKRGTTLTCYSCAGLGVIPDTREEVRQARQEIRKVQLEMEEERAELSGRQPKEESAGGRFCQSCAKSTKDNDIIKVCLVCFGKIKQVCL